MGFLDLADEILKELQTHGELEGGRILDGRKVCRVIWETDRAVLFQDDAGAFWRYLHAYRQAWPVIVRCKREPAEFLADVLGGKTKAKVGPAEENS